MQPQNLVGYVLLVIQVAALAMAAYAFVHAAIQRPDAFTAAEKLSKPIWLAIIGGTALLAFVMGAPVGSAIVACAAGIYIVDVRPKVLDVQGKSR